MRYIFGLVDSINGFKSMTEAGYAKESLEQLLKDKEEIFDSI